MALALFDIDGTLVTGEATERGLFRELCAEGLIGPRQIAAFAAVALRSWPAYGRHTFRKDKAWLAGLAVADVEARARAWVRARLPERWHVPCVERLRAHRAAGDRVVLLSGTLSFVADAIAAELDADAAVGSVCAVRDGHFLPAPALSHPFGATKVELARSLAVRQGLSLGDVIAYGDSIHDQPLLATAGRAVAVRPDRGLGAAARAAGWEILGQR